MRDTTLALVLTLLALTSAACNNRDRDTGISLAGRSQGDRILSVNGQSLTQVPVDAVNRWLWLTEKASVRLELVDPKGALRVALRR